MDRKRELVFLFDVGNTLLDNDRVQRDLFRHIGREFGACATERAIEIEVAAGQVTRVEIR